MTVPLSGSNQGIGRTLNTSVYPQQLLTASAYTYNNVPVAQVQLPQASMERIMTRIILSTTLTAADMVSTSYWDGYSIQAPFYLYQGVPAMSNILDVTQIGNFNAGEWYTPIRLQPNTDVWGIWLGVNAASAGKCQASIYLEVY